MRNGTLLILRSGVGAMGESSGTRKHGLTELRDVMREYRVGEQSVRALAIRRADLTVHLRHTAGVAHDR
jgi:hypothetical protein